MEPRADAGAPNDDDAEAGTGPPSGAAAAAVRHGEAIERILELAREQLGMDVACVGVTSEAPDFFRWTAGDARAFGVTDRRGPALAALGRMMVEGNLPPVLPDAAATDRPVSDLAVTAARVGAAIGAPIELSDGSAFGIIVCAARAPVPSLNEQDVGVLRVFARAVAKLVEGGITAPARHVDRRRIDAALAGDVLGMVFQPIVSLKGGHAIGYEALARFGGEPERSPDRWFAEAARAGRGVDLEMTAVRTALAYAEALPDGEFLSVNASPETVASPAFRDEVLASVTPERIVAELTTPFGIEDPRAFAEGFELLRAAGARLAVSDAGGGFSSLSHLIQLEPSIVKIDRLLVRDVHTDPVRRALVTADVHLARELDAVVVAEGIEVHADARTLLELGVEYGQGMLIAPPGPPAFPLLPRRTLP